jgi:hypothetical protein
MGPKTFVSCFLIATAVFLGCGNGSSGNDQGGGVLHIEPNDVAAGETVSVTVQQPSRGLTESVSTLEQRLGESWKPVYILGSQSPRYAEPVDGAGGGIEIGVGLEVGTTERIRIPRDLEEGEYRIVKSITVDEGEPFDVAGELRIVH